MAVHRRAQALRLLVVIAAVALASCGSGTEAPDNGRVCAVYAGQGSRVEVVADGTIDRVLGTRSGPSGEHEGFLLRLDGTCDLLVRVETNVSLTGPVPLHDGERVQIKGEYEYTPLGGVIHWTHRDPRGHHPDGWVSAGGKLYR